MRATSYLVVFGVLSAYTLALPSNADAQNARAPWRTSTVKGSPVSPTPYRVELAFPKLKFDNPKCVIELPETGRLLVAHGGKLVTFPKSKDASTTSLVAKLSEVEGTNADANTVAVHPNFLQNRYIFVAMGHGEGGWHSRVMRYTLTDKVDPTIVPGSGKLIVRWPGGGHGGGCLGFGKDGYLYISTGDGSGPTPPDKRTTGQDISDLLGAVLRIDVNSGDKPYEIPQDNPFVDLENARPEIWSYGLRNPWKFGIDSESNNVYVADNGWETWEVIHKLHRGSNCGWPIMEGRARLRTEVERGPTPITPPIKDHPHTEANSVIGGPVYRGQTYGDLFGSFVYGDYITGTVWSLTPNATGGHDHRTLADCDLHIVAFTEGSQGEIYLLDFDTTQQLYELVPSSAVDTSAEFPRQLSDTGIFEDTANLKPATGVVPYSIIAEPWMDGANAKRWVAIPESGSIDLENGTYPNGTVLVKHLSIPSELRNGELPLETQLLHYEDSVWNPYTYLWNEDGDDASLVDAQGENIEIQLTDDARSKRTWRAGSTNECRLCHNVGSGSVLGFNARQLDALDQLTDLAHKRILSNVPTYDGNHLVSPHDTAADLDDRGRSYLHMNCGICHNENGPATISFFAHRDYDFDKLRITKRPGVGDFGIKDAQLVKPGQPYKSIILYRLAKLGYGRMPYIGSRVCDSEGIELIESWIRTLAPNENDLHAKARNIEDALKSTEQALALSVKLHRGDATEDETKQALLAAATQHGDIRGIFDHFVPETERRQTLGRSPEPQTVLSLDGVSDRGELIFFSDNARCKSCHNPTDATESVGPTLAEIRKQYPRRSEMLTHILKPSEKVADAFAAWTFVLDDGKVFNGLILNETENEVKIKLADQRVVTLDRKSIEARKRSTKSLMPDGVLSDLTAQEAADLLAYLMQP